MDEKKHSLPDIKITSLFKSKGCIEEVFQINLDKLNNKIEKQFYENIKVDDVIDTDSLEFKDTMNGATLAMFLQLYNSFEDKDFIYAMWSYVDATLKMSVLNHVMDNKEDDLGDFKNN